MHGSASDDDRVPSGPLLTDEVPAIVPLSIHGPMTFPRAIELREALLSALSQRPSPVELDLSSVTELDSAGIQVLLLVKRTAKARNKEVLLVGQNLLVSSTLELLRLDDYLGLPAFMLFGEDSP